MSSAPAVRVFRVEEINRRVREKMESWGEIWIEGELTDVRRHASGHVYFTLVDGLSEAQLAGVIFRSDARVAKAKLVSGERVRVLGKLSIYQSRGTFQVVARLAETAGDGERRAELERLKKKLAAEGLFAFERKRRLPFFPQVVGLVTSRDGAAVHDVIRVASRRAPVRLLVSHCLVQGADAPLSIVQALARLERVPELDVVIVTRGGGGSEDLGAFNDERVARAIAACKVPVVTGVGHDVDETIADLVADLRAATPSNAAERVVPELGALQAQLGDLHRRLEQALESRIDRGRLGLERFGRRLSDPRHGLAGVRHRFQGLAAGLERATRQRVATERLRVTGLERRLGRVDPRAALARDRATLEGLERRLLASGKPLAGRARRELAASETRLRVAARPRLERARALFGEATARLGALSPLSILARGYAIALHAPSGRALVSSSDAAVGDAIDLRLSAGSLRATVVEVRDP